MTGRDLRHLSLYASVRILIAVVLSLGYDRAAALARALAGAFFRVSRKHRERAERNLRKALPELPAEERQEIGRAACCSFALTFVEMIYLHRLVTVGTSDRTLDIEIHPEARAALESGRGAIFAAAHIGNWELSGAAAALLGYPISSVARPIDNPFLQRFFLSTRERTGQKIIAKRGALREVGPILARGHFVGILVDQNAGKRGVFVDYFGRPASTTGTPATLALRYGVPILPTWQRRVGPGFHHEIRVERPLDVPLTGNREEDVRELTRAMTARVESWVRREPGQWLWLHRRWKTKPEQGRRWQSNPSISNV